MRYPRAPGWKAQGPSREAAHSITGHAKTVRERVRVFFNQAYPAAYTADEIAHQLSESILTIRPRISELHKNDQIEAVAERRKNVSGMSAHCWRAKGGAQ